MAKMTLAAGAKHLGSDHAMAEIALLLDMAFGSRRGKTRPAAAGIEFGVRLEQRLAAAGANIGARALLMFVFARERPFGVGAPVPPSARKDP